MVRVKKGILKIFADPASISRYVREQKAVGKTVGFVPTMGSLHEGHASLFRKAVETSDCVIASIFVNPAQFGDREDFEHYPHHLDQDFMIAEKAGVHALFTPDEQSIYPSGMDFTVRVHTKTDVLCGVSRPGHFEGVATVLTKLFNIIQPDHVYFGMKDAQQAAIISSLIHSFHYSIQMHLCPINRESDGLARSSRNLRLTPDERQEAPEVYRGLQAGLLSMKNGERRRDQIIDAVMSYYSSHLVLGAVDYVDLLSYPELTRRKDPISGPFILACAINYRQARLIDNITANTADLS
ncbi:pantoate--beta-alanine ligase [Sporolactobacillus sp. Y61]|uniref:Pantothenate synthetase n=1 Tax=Sporolactobacillus sp. Y61 TaxID=3160863 RepID=A0AAU8IDF0_9BACL